jgi:hypothetical protein
LVGMRMTKTINSATCSLLAMILFLLTISVMVVSPKLTMKSRENSISKQATAPTSSDDQSLYEEQETEINDEMQDGILIFCSPAEPIFSLPSNNQHLSPDNCQTFAEVMPDVPLYLSKRVLLI